MYLRITLTAAALALAGCTPTPGQNDVQQSSSPASPRPNQASTLVVTSVSQSSHGVGAEDIDSSFVAMMEEHFVEQAKKHYEVAMQNMGYPGESIEYEVGTVMFNENGEKLAVTTLKPNQKGTISKVAWWIADGEIKRAVCADTAGNEVPVRFGPCAAKIAEVFGYRNWPLDSKLP